MQRYDTTVPVVEEFVSVPDEERYNNPPEAGYRKPPIKKEMSVKQGIGPGGPMSGGMGGPGGMNGGMGGQGFGGQGR